jgi:hypothetical protein
VHHGGAKGAARHEAYWVQVSSLPAPSSSLVPSSGRRRGAPTVLGQWQ